MGFVLSVLYFVICFLTPVGLFGQVLSQLRIELILAILIFAISLPRIIRSFVSKTTQALALVGLTAAVFLSMLIGMGWTGGATAALVQFIPAIYAYFLVGLHCNSRRKMAVLVLMLFFVSLFVIVQGSLDLLHTPTQVVAETVPGDIQDTVTLNSPLWNVEHPYIVAQQTSPFEWILRLRGLGIINDPNDLGQLLACVFPLVFIFWQPKKFIRNFAFAILPASLLCYGVYLTHSRGTLLALIAIILVAARRHVGTVPAVVVAGALFAGAFALKFTGGRVISADAGADRTALWGGGLQLLKTHPFFGVGAGQLPDLMGLTAHNSIVVCVAELGLFGLFFWSLFLLPTARDAFMIATPKRVGESVNPKAAEVESSLHVWRGAALDKTDINRLGFCLFLSLIAFLFTGWFLSRAFTMTFFLLGGMIEVVYEAALSQGMVAPRLPLTRTLLYSTGLMIFLIVLVYATLRVLNLFPHPAA